MKGGREGREGEAPIFSFLGILNVELSQLDVVLAEFAGNLSKRGEKGVTVVTPGRRRRHLYKPHP